MKGSKKIMFLFTLLFCLLILGGCGKSNIYMYDTITVTSLEAEPANWKSDESLLLLADAALPSELQKAYMDLISKGCNEVVLKDPKGWQATVSSNENGIYVGDEANNLKFFQSSSGNIVEIGKVYRTLYRSEYFDGESQKAYNTIELDYSVDDPTLVKLAVTRDFLYYIILRATLISVCDMGKSLERVWSPILRLQSMRKRHLRHMDQTKASFMTMKFIFLLLKKTVRI